jgi:photosynthetic reaction center H subunit
MQTGAITSYIDVAQLTLYAFWIFFAGLIIYLRREDKREGYPLVSERPEEQGITGFPPMPPAKTFLLAHGETRIAPREEMRRKFSLAPAAVWPGAPFVPTGNPMVDGVGPAAYALRADVPDPAFEDGKPKIVPLRVAAEYSLAAEDPDLIGWTVVGADGAVAGSIIDVWIDRTEMLVRYLEVALTAPLDARSVLLPSGYAVLAKRDHEIRVDAILGEQFADVPALQSADQVTLREEDRISGYYAGGYLYATPERAEPLL